MRAGANPLIAGLPARPSAAEGIDIDDIEALGQHAAPKLDAYYKDRIAELDAERTRLHARACRKKKQMSPLRSEQAEAMAISTNWKFASDVCKAKYFNARMSTRKEFEHYAKLSARHMTVSDEVEDIGQQLSAHRQTLKHLREGSKTQMRERAARGNQREQLENRLGQLWDTVTREPALLQVISRRALERAVKVHVGQTSEQMHT